VGSKLVVASSSGNSLLFTSLGALPGDPAGTVETYNLAERETNGWTTTPLSFPDVNSLIAPLGSFIDGPVAFSSDLSTAIWTNTLPLLPGESKQGTGLFLGAPAAPFTLLTNIGSSGKFLGASENLQTVVFSSEGHLLSGDAGRVEGSSLYEITRSALRLVDVNDEGSLLSECGSNVPNVPNAISRDGNRIFFVSPDPSTLCPQPSQVYLREAGHTIKISASQCPNCDTEQSASFVGATPSGSYAFFVTRQQLTYDDVDSDADLYRYDVATGALSRIAPTRPPRFSPGEVTDKAIWVSSDGSQVYFIRELAEGNNEEDLYRADSKGVHLVAPFGGTDSLQISDDGRYAVFSTTASLEEGDSDDSADIYRYDATTGSYTRLSDGGIGGGNGAFDAHLDSIADEGQKVFFSTAERLLPEDQNEVEDIYEWADGSLGLISAGTGDLPAHYLTSTPDGRTVFFKTAATLMPQDRDGGDNDIYAARVGGGFTQAALAPSCTGEDCRVATQGRIARLKQHGVSDAIGLARIGPAARRQIVSTGRMRLLLEAPTTGHLSARASTQIGQHVQRVASGGVSIKQPGPVRLGIPLTRVVRRDLARGNSLRVRLILRLSHFHPAREVNFLLRGGA
jgi:hypothetical protein